MCYRDRMFCPFFEECVEEHTCDLALTKDVLRDAALWWKSMPGEAPISQFTDRPRCFREKKGGQECKD